MRNFYSQIGFTLLEILVTVGVLGIVAAFAAPNLSTFVERRQIQLQASRINDAFTLGRSIALSQGAGANVCWNTGGPVDNDAPQNTIVVTRVDVNGNTEVVKSVGIEVEGYQVSDTSAAGRCITFNALGRANSGVSVGVCKLGGDINNMLTVNLTNTGRPSIARADKGNPNPNNFVCQ